MLPFHYKVNSTSKNKLTFYFIKTKYTANIKQTNAAI
jgi:hypothetical protein